MARTNDQIAREIFGSQILQIIALTTEKEKLQEEVDRLTIELRKKHDTDQRSE